MNTIPELVDRIVNVHHAYIRTAGPAISARLVKLCGKHGAQHPNLLRIAEQFTALRDELDQHMFKEERILFPYVRDLAEHEPACGGTRSPFGSVENPIRMMEREHDDVIQVLKTIRELTNNFSTPDDVCKGFGLGMGELEAFERDLLEHIHLENDILFPAALELEQRLALAR
jgi:regulator of cell morphogenesis and NO signaling